MPIEFRCPNCDKKLRTADEKAGSTAKCPQCGTAIEVPAAAEPDDFGDFGEFETTPAGLPPRRGSATPARSFRELPCPLCGAMNPADADRCHACGETLTAAPRSGGQETSTRFDVGDMLSRGWELFQADMGVNVAVALLYIFIPGVLNQVFSFVGRIAIGLVQNAGVDQAVTIAITAVGFLAMFIVFFFVQSFFDAGYTKFLLNVIHRRPATVGDLFSGGPFMLPLALNRAVIGLACLAMFLPAAISFVLIPVLGGDVQPVLVIVGAVLGLLGWCGAVALSVYFWPYVWLIVDRNPGGLEPLKASLPLTRGNRGAIILMGLLYWLLFFGGYMACCIGMIFTLPIANLMAGVAYDRLIRAKGMPVT